MAERAVGNLSVEVPSLIASESEILLALFRQHLYAPPDLVGLETLGDSHCPVGGDDDVPVLVVAEYTTEPSPLCMIGFGENVGSGFPKIIAAWKETNWGEPQLMNKLDVDEVGLVLPVPSIKATSDTVPANAPVNAPVNAPANAPVNAPANAPVKLNKTQSAIVKAMRNDNHITYEDLGTIVEVDRSTIRRNIAVLKEKGVIRRVGEDKNGYWEVLLDIKIVD